MDVIVKEPNRLVTYHALSYQQSKNQASEGTANFEVNSEFFESIKVQYALVSNQIHSIGLLHLAAIRTSLISDYQNNQFGISIALKRIAASIPQCPALLFNIFIAQQTAESPIWLRMGNEVTINWTLPSFVHQNFRHYGQCLNKASIVIEKASNSDYLDYSYWL